MVLGIDLHNLACCVGRICGENNQVDIDCFVSCQQFVMNVINNEYFPSFKESVYYLRHQADILTRCDVTLRDVLYNQSALFYFTEVGVDYAVNVYNQST